MSVTGTFQYTVWQHHPGHRGEAVNFGVTVKDLSTGRTLTKFSSDTTRLEAIDPNFVKEFHHAMYKPDVVHAVDEEPGALTPHHGGMAEAMSVTQRTEARGGVLGFSMKDIDEALEHMFDRFVAPIPKVGG